MSPADHILLARWQERRDANAFQDIVARHGAMVYAVCRRILRNPTDAEDVAQECFLALAQADSGSVRVLGGWLHRFATHRALDRVRADSRRQKRERRYAEGQPQLTEPTWPELQEFVDEAIAELPQELHSIVVAHYLEGVTQTDIAESMNASPSTISRRIDRAVNQIRETLRKRGVVVGTGLLAGMLAEAASASPPKTLYAALAKLALSGSRRIPSGVAAVGAGAGIPIAGKWAITIAGLIAIGALGFVYSRLPESPPPSTPSEANATTEPPQVAAPAAKTADADSFARNTASVSGTVVFRDTGEPAPRMRVLIDAEGAQPRSTETDEEGMFIFDDAPIGKVAVLAYDMRHPDVPEDWLHSDHIELDVSTGVGVENVRIEVPPLGGEIIGTVTDRDTGVPLARIEIEAYGPAHGQRVRTNREGRYTILGLEDGEWPVSISTGNPIFHDPSSENINSAMVETGKTTELDFAVDRSISVSGRVIDADGVPVADAGVSGTLYTVDRHTRRGGHTATDAQGRFTLWGGVGGERVVLSARERQLASESASFKTSPGQPVRDIVLTLYPKQTVSGRFENETGQRVEAELWCRPIHSDGPGEWRGYSDSPSDTFAVSLARGSYEMQGRVEANIVKFADQTQKLDVSGRDLDHVVVVIPSTQVTHGNYSLRGVVRDESGAPLRNTRVYMHGAQTYTMRASQETHTDSTGHFSFAGLREGEYRVHATPSLPYERFAGFDHINPALADEVEITVRRAGRLRGRVIDASSRESVTEFDVEAGNYDGSGNENRWELKNITTDSGEFDFTALLDKEWFVRVEAVGYAESVHMGAALASGEVVDDILFELEPGRVVRGTVTDPGGQPVAGALVFDNGDVFNVIRRNSRYAAATTDVRGTFTIDSIPEDTQIVYVLKPGFAIGEATIDNEVDIVLTAGGTINGHIAIAEAIPMDTIDVTGSTSHHGHPEHYSSAVDETGYYHLDNVTPGTYRLQLNHRDGSGNHLASYYLDAMVSVGDGLITTQDISIPVRSGILNGVVTYNGTPAPHRTLQFSWDGITAYAHTDDAGRYRIGGLTGRRVRVDVPMPDTDNPGKQRYRTVAEIDFGNAAETRRDIELSEFE